MRYTDDDGSWQDDSASSNVVKKPNPRNADSLVKIKECQVRLKKYYYYSPNPHYLIPKYQYQMTKLSYCCCYRS